MKKIMIMPFVFLLLQGCVVEPRGYDDHYDRGREMGHDRGNDSRWHHDDRGDHDRDHDDRRW